MTKPNRPLDNVSLTAYRVIAILNMLNEGPHTEQEINEKLTQDADFSRALSRDSIWLYINTLKALGCVITRPSRKNNYTYVLNNHPFKINFTNQEVRALIEVRKYVSEISNWELSCNFDRFLSNISLFMEDEHKKVLANFRKSKLRDIDYTLKRDIINQIEEHCEKNNVIAIIYNSPSGNIVEIRLIAETIKYENGALYLWGYNVNLEESQYLRIDRIESIKSYESQTFSDIKQPPLVRYKLYGVHTINYNPDDDEKIISQDDNSIMIETLMKNKFKFVQKVLSLGRDCEVVYPEELRKEILKKLKVMNNLYNNNSR